MDDDTHLCKLTEAFNLSTEWPRLEFLVLCSIIVSKKNEREKTHFLLHRNVRNFLKDCSFFFQNNHLQFFVHLRVTELELGQTVGLHQLQFLFTQMLQSIQPVPWGAKTLVFAVRSFRKQSVTFMNFGQLSYVRNKNYAQKEKRVKKCLLFKNGEFSFLF